MKILITGAGGFIGRNLLEKIPLKHQVIGIFHNVKPTVKRNNIILTKGDITNSEFVRNQVKGIDIIIHLAAIKANECEKKPVNAILTNIYGTHNLVNAAKKEDCRFIFASSYHVYGKQKTPFKEDMKLKPDSIYGASKAFSEYEIRDLLDDFLLLRFTMVYGNDTKSKQLEVTSKFVKAVLNNESIKIYGSGEQKLDLIYIDDITDILSKVIEIPELKGVFNIGSGKSVSINELATIVSEFGKKIFNKKVKIERIKRAGDYDRYVSIDKIKNAIGWKPKITLERGVEEITKQLKEVHK
jgi:nucleoside-diphosphate-sugar epimerase